jgi:hypothetical protein
VRSHRIRYYVTRKDSMGIRKVLVLFIGSFMNCYLLHAQILGDHEKARCNVIPPYTRSRSRKRNAKPLSRSWLNILLERTKEGVLLCGSLVCTVTKLRRRVDPLQLNLLQCLSRGVNEHRLSESHDPLLDTRNRTLEDDKVVLDLTISNKATHTASC